MRWGDDVAKQCDQCPFRTRALCAMSTVGCRVKFERACPLCGSALVVHRAESSTTPQAHRESVTA